MVDQFIANNKEEKLLEVFQEFADAGSLTKFAKAGKLLGQVDLLMESTPGIELIYQHVVDFQEAGIFAGSPWEDPTKLVAGLVSGTLKSGHPNSTIELLSELRLLAIAEGRLKSKTLTRTDAEQFVQEVIVHNLEFLFNEPLEETRLIMSEHELNKVHCVFNFLSGRIHLDEIKEKLVEELTLICAQRPVVTEKQRKIIALVREKLTLNPEKGVDKDLLAFEHCIYEPTKQSKGRNLKQYETILGKLDNTHLHEESAEMGLSMLQFGLVSQYHAVLLLYLVKKKHYNCVPEALGLDQTGTARWEVHRGFICDLITQTIHACNAQCIFGLAKMLEKGLLSRDAVRSGLYNLSKVVIHSKVAERILKSTKTPHEAVSPRQYLMGALFRILGQPLGVGQGNNPTCQSARGISMWSQHAPAKLINMVQTAATVDDISFRFEGKEIKASETGKGLVQTLDHNLDAVSVTLVPLLDRIYNEMMLRGSGRGEDPHKWVNPALYGQWVQIGFASAYDYPYNAIMDFEGFVRIFYAMGHPLYNGGHRLIYPNPTGIFITSAKGEMLGFHAVSLLRVEKDPQGQFRAYFLNPNNEGRQDWGQGIKPSVFGHGELPGESSLPFHEFAGRVYAFHFNSLEAREKMDQVPKKEVARVQKIARESWGKAYNWLEIKKIW